MKINLREPRTQKAILSCIAIAGAGYYYFVSDTLSFSYRSRSKIVAEKKESRDKLTSEVKKARAGAERLAELQKESAQLEESWQQVEARLPAELDSKELMSEMTSLGTRESLQFLLLEPQAARPLDFCQEVPYSVRVLGYYHQLGRFLADLDNQPRILKLSGLRVVQNPKSKDDKEEAPIIAELEISTYVLGGGGPPPNGTLPVGELGAATPGAAPSAQAKTGTPAGGTSAVSVSTAGAPPAAGTKKAAAQVAAEPPTPAPAPS